MGTFAPAVTSFANDVIRMTENERGVKRAVDEFIRKTSSTPPGEPWAALKKGFPSECYAELVVQNAGTASGLLSRTRSCRIRQYCWMSFAVTRVSSLGETPSTQLRHLI
jgi:hypothetical protein